MHVEKRKAIDYLNSHIIQLILKYRSDLFWIFVASSIANLLMLTPMIYMLQIFDRIFISKSLFTLFTISAIIVFFYAITSISSYIRSKIIIAIGARIETEINESLFFAAMREKVIQNKKNPTSYMDDLTLVRQWLTGAAVFTIFDFPWVPIYIIIMFVLHPILGMFAIALIVILMALGLFFAFYMGNQDEMLRQEEYETNNFIYGKLRNHEVIQAYDLARNFKSTWLQYKKDFYVMLVNAEKKSDAVLNLMKQFRFFSSSLALTVGAFLVIYGELTMGSMIAAALLMARTTQPVDAAVGTFSKISIVREAFWRLENLLRNIHNTSESKRKNNYLSDEKYIIKEEVRLDSVSAFYANPDVEIISGINISFKPGSAVAVVGESGAGKTTMIKMLAGLTNYSGNIMIDGIDLRQFSVEDNRKLLGFLPQDVMLLPGTIAENISSLRKPNSQRVVEVAKLVGIHQFILKFPNGYDTFLGGTGLNLSGGERQRIGLARAIYGDPAIIILDEPNSALDQSGELALKNVITNQKSLGKIVVIVTHRRAVIAYSDWIVELSSGNVSQFCTTTEYIKGFKNREAFDRKFTF